MPHDVTGDNSMHGAGDERRSITTNNLSVASVPLHDRASDDNTSPIRSQSTLFALRSRGTFVDMPKSPSRSSWVGTDDRRDVPPCPSLSTHSSIDFSQPSLPLQDSNSGPGFSSLHFNIVRWMDGIPDWVNSESEPHSLDLNTITHSPSPTQFETPSVDGTTVYGGSQSGSWNHKTDPEDENEDRVQSDGNIGSEPARSRLQRSITFVFNSLLLLHMPYLSAFRVWDEEDVNLGTYTSSEDLERSAESAGHLLRARRLSSLRRNLSFLFWVCTLLLPAVVGSMSTASQVNDATVMNFAAVAACFLLVAILHVRCLRHFAETLEVLDHSPEATERDWNYTFGRTSVLVATPFAWTAWGLILFLCLAIMTLLRLPIPLCDIGAKAEQTWFPSCRPPSVSGEVFIYLGLPCRIITAATVVLGISHGAFNFYTLSTRYPW